MSFDSSMKSGFTASEKVNGELRERRLISIEQFQDREVNRRWVWSVTLWVWSVTLWACGL